MKPLDTLTPTLGEGEEAVSNPSHGTLKRERGNQDGLLPYILDSDGSSEQFRKNWAGFILLWQADLARIFHESLAPTADRAVLPDVLGCRPLRRTVQVRIGTNTLRLSGGTAIFAVSRYRFRKHPGWKIYEVDPLVCPECNGQMQFTGFQRTKVLLHHGLA